MKFKVVFNRNAVNPDRTYIVDETNFIYGHFEPGTILIGLDGKVYENYGLKGGPMWEEVYDNDYEIELIKED